MLIVASHMIMTSGRAADKFGEIMVKYGIVRNKYEAEAFIMKVSRIKINNNIGLAHGIEPVALVHAHEDDLGSLRIEVSPTYNDYASYSVVFTLAKGLENRYFTELGRSKLYELWGIL